MMPQKTNQHTSSLFLNFCAGLLIAVAAGGTVSQQKPDVNEPRRPLVPESSTNLAERLQPPFRSPKDPVNCEVAGRYIDDAIARTTRAEGTYLIVIVRNGNREKALRVNQMRLAQVKAYLEYTHLPKFLVAAGESILVAAGESINDRGRIEIYVEGKLLYTLPLRRNQGLDLLSCVAV